MKVALKFEQIELIKRVKIDGGKISNQNSVWKFDRNNFFEGIKGVLVYLIEQCLDKKKIMEKLNSNLRLIIK